VPWHGVYGKLLSTDDVEWGGSGFASFDSLNAELVGMHGYGQSIELDLPPLAALVLAPRRE